MAPIGCQLSLIIFFKKRNHWLWEDYSTINSFNEEQASASRVYATKFALG